MIKNIHLALFAFALLFVFNACNDDDDKQNQTDEKIIQDYLEQHDISAKRHSSGLYFKIIEDGTGKNPTAYSTVEVNYKGYLTNGNVFDQTNGKSIQFSLINVIEGWQIGIPLLREGGRGQFFIPSGLAYGDRAIGSIPPNSVLIFEVDLITVY